MEEKRINMFRLSVYTIAIDLENEKDKIMLIHGYTGAIDIADKEMYTSLKKLEYFLFEKVSFSQKTWDAMLQRGYITSKTREEEYAFVSRMADAFHKRNKLFREFVFIPSYDCNFRCPYCVEKSVSDNGYKWSKNTFTKEMVDKAYDAMKEIGPHPEFNLKQILLYGGEPLLRENKEIVYYIVEKGRQQGYRFKAITNGYDLEVFRELLSPEEIYTLQITLDGTKEWHDKRRRHHKNGESFDKIMSNIQMALQAGIDVTVRVNIDKNNFDSIEKLNNLFKNRGFYNDKERFFVTIGWLHDNHAEGKEKTQPNGTELQAENVEYLELNELNRKLEKNKTDVTCPSDYLYANIQKAIISHGRVALSATSCSSQSGTYIFDPQGSIFNCLEVVGKREYRLGNYAHSETVVWNEGELNKWHSLNISTSPTCCKCKYAFLCRGGCTLKKIKNPKEKDTCKNFPGMLNTAANKAYQEYLRRR